MHAYLHTYKHTYIQTDRQADRQILIFIEGLQARLGTNNSEHQDSSRVSATSDGRTGVYCLRQELPFRHSHHFPSYLSKTTNSRIAERSNCPAHASLRLPQSVGFLGNLAVSRVQVRPAMSQCATQLLSPFLSGSRVSTQNPSHKAGKAPHNPVTL